MAFGRSHAFKRQDGCNKLGYMSLDMKQFHRTSLLAVTKLKNRQLLLLIVGVR